MISDLCGLSDIDAVETISEKPGEETIASTKDSEGQFLPI